MTGAALLGLLAALAGVGLAFSSGLLISRAALRPEDFLSLTLLVTTVRALGLGRAALRYAERVVGHAEALRGAQRLRLALFDTVARFGRDLLAFERSGDVLARSGADVDARMFHALRVTLPLWALVAVVVMVVAVLLHLDPLLAGLAGVPLVVAAVPTWLARAHVAALAREESDVTRRHASALLDALASSSDGAGRVYAPALGVMTATLEDLSLRLGAVAWRVTLLRELAFGVAVCGVLWRGATLVAGGEVPGPLLAAVTLGTAAAFDALTPLAAVPAASALDRRARERAAMLDAVQPAVRAPAMPVPVRGGPLALVDVSVVRAGRTVVQGATVTLHPGDRVSLSGPSGGGKTTLARLLTRDVDPDGGRVTLGGVDLRDLDPDAVRARISVHEQDAPLLDGTLRENVLLGDHHAPDARLRTLLDALDLGHLPLDVWVGEGGTRLSGGERARVSVARALLRPSEVLILDEPTAHLDGTTETRVLDVIRRELGGRTLLLITHREAPLGLVMRHLTLRGGQLTAGAAGTRTAI
ncbi:ABC-type transport system involved in cytochrome bd biosynthesis fused ATPase/permease subunit [Deinococcus metalli]|uniref:ABC-type transport system involved in cytochrome bd biosynthesis fused ATPase/permease subunit n=1 Tax=Deinococcus metalli TaxID=1141878 RepID=A0A7W8KEF2_9DEIO|nr:ATP-binding cassette domain-containing protein [Deinococcus metalli]MBB5376660.1 ABC-type transport system involved in cytochrome bd biosynthesis fused ATPase/permease subunit [Deinococcus metalli]GHF42434.1 thiol reductant ABC exporter subunit CydC [Deinococcus metalli]